MKYIRFCRDFVYWVWDWYVFPIVEMFLPSSNKQTEDQAKASHDQGQTLHED